MADTAFVLDLTSYVPNVTYTFSFDTTINVDYAGFEYRYPKLFSHKLKISVSDYVFQGAYGVKCDGYSKEDFLAFFDSVRGCQDTFLVRCLLDYKVGRQSFDPIYSYSNTKVFSDGLLQQVNTTNPNEYIFVKRYAHDGVQSYKTLYNLDYIGNIYSQTGVVIPPSQYAINCNLAGDCRLVRNGTMPVGTTPSYFDGTYKYRVRFANPTIEIEQTSGDLFRVNNFELVSHVEPERFKLFGSDYPRSTNTTTRSLLLKGDLVKTPTNSIFPRSNTEGKPIQSYSYGWRNENVEANSTGLKAVDSRSRESLVNIQPKMLNNLETSLLLNQFLANKGRLVMFNYKYGTNFGNNDVKARFDTDELNFSLRTLNEQPGQDCEGLWEVSNLSIKNYPTSVTPYVFDAPFASETPLACTPTYSKPPANVFSFTAFKDVPSYAGLDAYTINSYYATNVLPNGSSSTNSKWRLIKASYQNNLVHLILQSESVDIVNAELYAYYKYSMVTGAATFEGFSTSLSSYNSLNLTSPTSNISDSATGVSLSAIDSAPTSLLTRGPGYSPTAIDTLFSNQVNQSDPSIRIPVITPYGITVIRHVYNNHLGTMAFQVFNTSCPLSFEGTGVNEYDQTNPTGLSLRLNTPVPDNSIGLTYFVKGYSGSYLSMGLNTYQLFQACFIAPNKVMILRRALSSSPVYTLYEHTIGTLNHPLVDSSNDLSYFSYLPLVGISNSYQDAFNLQVTIADPNASIQRLNDPIISATALFFPASNLAFSRNVFFPSPYGIMSIAQYTDTLANTNSPSRRQLIVRVIRLES